jgi:hypothetical protein
MPPRLLRRSGRTKLRSARELVKKMASLVEAVKGFVRRNVFKKYTSAEFFTYVYEANVWLDTESRSGIGSRRDSRSVADTMEALEMMYQTRGVRTISDIPCGDFNWMPLFLSKHSDVDYQGYDIVAPLIKRNRAEFPNTKFNLFDIVADVPPKTDLILCKDLLNHLSFDDVRRALSNMKASGSTWLIASNNFGFRNVELEMNLAGATRHLDICQRPLNYPAPVWRTHYLGLWRLADL